MNLEDLRAKCAELIAAYVRRAPSEVHVYPDPGEHGTIAVRAVWGTDPKLVLDFLLTNMDKTRLMAEALAKDVFEVEFPCWPPPQRPGGEPVALMRELPEWAKRAPEQ